MDCFGSVCLIRRSGNRHAATNNMNGLTEMRKSTSLEWSNQLQLFGSLYKRPFNHQSTKWTKRFFVIKDGYLFYYSDNERKEMEKRKCLNIHPKGVIPLGESTITPAPESGQPNAFYIDSEEINGRLLLAAENPFERDKWIDMLERCKRVNWKNAQLADNMIAQLEHQGLQMAKQKQDYFDQLQSEVMALSEEKEKSEELERLNQELEKEKVKLEQYQQELTEEFEGIKQELESTAEYMKTLESDRQELSQTINVQKENLQTLAVEKEEILSNLKMQNESKEQIESRLQKIENKTKVLLQEKAVAEQRLQENEMKACMLEEEREHFDKHAEELQETIKDLKAQKEMTESELKEEVMARLEAERRLKEAEESLGKLGAAVETQTPNIHEDVKEEMVVNVVKLKKFFEELSNEAKLDSDKPVVVKNAIHARKTLQRRAKNKQFERKRSSSMRVKSLNFDKLSTVTDEDGLISPVRRCLTTVRKGQSLNFALGREVLYEEEYL